jgi:flagellar motor switch protein FliN
MPELKAVENWIALRWAAEFASVIELRAGLQASVTAEPSEGPEAEDLTGSSWVRVAFSAGSRAFVWLYAADQTIALAGRTLATAAGAENGDEATTKGTWSEILSQSFSGLAAKIFEKTGIPMTAGPVQSCSAPDDRTGHYTITARLPDTSFTLGLAISPTLCSELAGGQDGTAPSSQGDVSKRGSKVAEMDLVFEIELPVTVSFGRTYLPLRDVLKLTTGSIVELDRLITEPVDIIVNNCVVARGEVVVIEGNYGVRVTDVVDRSDRLALRNAGRPLRRNRELELKAGA